MAKDILLDSLGHAVRRLRTERGFTLKELAAHAGLSARFLGEVESGEGNISVRNLGLLAHALRSTPAALLAPSKTRQDTRLVALLGLRGAGKSTIGRRLARRLHLPFLELDRQIEEAAGLSVAEIFSLHGEPYYRRLEHAALEQLFAEGRRVVLATGGGIVAAPATFDLLRRNARTVWLRARPEDHWNRVVRQGDRRPMADHPEAMAELRRLLVARGALYARAEHTVDTSRLGVDATVSAVMNRLGEG
jgi:XRE family aerobic/anaerobic benzoate catabolism transcriptional regulator